MEQDKHNSSYNDKANNQAQSFGKRASDTAAELVQSGRAAIASATEKVEKAGSMVAGKTDSVLSSFGKSMNNLADTIHDNAPSDGMVSSAAESVADGLKSGGDYLSQQGIEGMSSDLTGIIKRHPWTSLSIGLGLGVFLGSSISRR